MGGNLDKSVIDNLLHNYNLKWPRVFIETGTYQPVKIPKTGELRIPTIFHMSPHFEQLYTIEIVEDIHNNSVNFVNSLENPYSDASNKINFILGSSQEKLKEVCKIVDKPAMFYLDGHYSADWNGVKTGRSGKEKDVPLYEELQIIHDHFQNQAIIVCDDLRLFGGNYDHGDWSKISVKKAKQIVEDRLIASEEDSCAKDTLVLILKEIKNK
tara:strand:- start:8552 stop:9187 length:636 start_codon:yes stop_codon:yes gene_type:complete